MIRIVTAFAAAIALASAGTAAAVPKAKVTPNMHLTNGKKVKVTGKGFSGGETVYIAECHDTTGESACDLNNLVEATTTAKGLVPLTKFTVVTGTIGDGSCGTDKADRKCYIAISNGGLTEYAFAPIVFTVP